VVADNEYIEKFKDYKMFGYL